jgi:hypothetical protein
MVNGDNVKAVMVTQGEVIGLLSDILANLVLLSDNTGKVFGTAVNEHRDTVRKQARRLSLKGDEDFNQTWPAIWVRICGEAEAKVETELARLVKAAPWRLVAKRVRK